MLQCECYGINSEMNLNYMSSFATSVMHLICKPSDFIRDILDDSLMINWEGTSYVKTKNKYAERIFG